MDSLHVDSGLYLGVPFRSHAWHSWRDDPRIIDPDASDREFTYDGRHRMVTQTTKTDFTTIYTYDHAGRIAAATLPDGAVRQLFNAQSAAVVDTSSGPGSSAANPVPFLRATDAITTYVDAEGRV